MHIVGYLSIRDRLRASSGIAGDEFGVKNQPETGLPASTPASPSASEDTVSFSEKALAMARARKAEEAAARDDAENGTQNAGNGLSGDSDAGARGTVGSAPESGSASMAAMPGRDSANQNLEALKKQIETAKEQLDKANQELQKAQAEARSDPAVVSEEDSGDVKDARNVVSETNSRLMQLQEQMNRAMRDAYGIGPGGGGQIQGTRAQGMGSGGNFGGHIGEATDPYAAARAAEAAEMGGAAPAPDTAE